MRKVLGFAAGVVVGILLAYLTVGCGGRQVMVGEDENCRPGKRCVPRSAQAVDHTRTDHR
jgi:hypothetical protein